MKEKHCKYCKTEFYFIDKEICNDCKKAYDEGYYDGYNTKLLETIK